MEISVLAAFGAGLLSFLSPCILPIVPFYLTYLAGDSVQRLAADGAMTGESRRNLIVSAAVFSAGIITVFVFLGLISTSVGQFLRAYFDVLRWLAAAVVFVMGLHFVGALKIGLLFRQFGGRSGAPQGGSLIASYLLGLSFAFGWTPCVGPILAAILFMAAGQDAVSQGAWLLVSYGLGMTLPFMIAAAFVAPFLTYATRLRSYLPYVENLTGVLLIVFAILIASDSMSLIANWLLNLFPGFARIG